MTETLGEWADEFAQKRSDENEECSVMACDRESAGCKMRDLVDRLLKVPGSMTGDCYDASDYTFLFDTFVREVVGRRTFDKQKAEKN